MSEQQSWTELIQANPEHSTWYVQRFRKLAADGADLAGEARLIDAMVGRGSRILDAGAGTGRVGAALAAAGHTVIGVDIDPVLVAAARQDHPGATWLVGDLAALDLQPEEGFDVIVSAGNVVTFVDPAARRTVLTRLAAHLRTDGRLVIGFGADRGYPFTTFFEDAAAAGLRPVLKLSTWDLRPFADDSTFLVAILDRATGDAP